jgi:osmotically-inducible protein OsmY
VVLRYAEGTASLLERWRIDSRKFFHFTTEEILHLAQDGNVLIEGWEAAKPLWDVRGVISVRVCAATDFRMRVLMNQQGSSDANAALAQIEREAAARERSVRPYFKVVEEEARVHDVTFNTERLSVESCVDTIAELAGRRWFPDCTAVRSTLADKFLEARIGSAFAEHISPSLAPLGVSVSVAHGKVTLDGISYSGSLRRRAERIARTVSGRLRIENRIVSVPSHGRFRLSECRASNETGSVCQGQTGRANERRSRDQ